MEKLKKQLAEIDGKIDAILAADALTDGSRKSLESLRADRKGVEERIALQKEADRNRLQREQLEAETQAQEAAAERIRRMETSNRLTQPDAPGASGQVSEVIRVAAQPIDHVAEGRWGWQNMAHFAMNVRQSAIRKRETPEMSRALELPHAMAAAQGMGEALGSEDGYLVPPTFMTGILSRIYGPQSLLGRTDQYTVTGNAISFPRNLESSRATGSRYGGVQGYWKGEGSAPTLSKPKTGKFNLTLKKLIALCATTDELQEDAGPALNQYIERAFTDEVEFLIGDAIMNGTGAGQPQGIIGASCAVSVSKETGQVAATIVPANIVKMYARMWAGCRGNAVWFINQDTEPQLNLMSFGLGTAGVMLYMPPGGLSAAPYATLMGRPVIPTEFNATLGTVGDIVLADLSQYVTITKGGPAVAVSIHLYFDTDEQAFRITFRIDGAPWWATVLTPFNGSATQSCVVTLATRS